MIRSSVWLRLSLALACLFFVDGSRAEVPGRRVVVDGNGAALRSFDSAGRPIAEARADGGAAAPRTPHRLMAAAASSGGRQTVVSDLPGTNLEVGADGVVRARDGSTPAPRAVSNAVATAAIPATIDSMTTRTYYASYTPALTLQVLGGADTYYLSDGSSWESGAGSYQIGGARLDRVEVDGNTVRYYLIPPADGVLYAQTDFDSGDHSAQGSLGASGPLVIEATIGATTAVLHGAAELLSNDSTSYGSLFNYYSAVVGSVLPVEVTYQLGSGSWGPHTFDSSFTYSAQGRVDFANPISVPKLLDVQIVGSGQVPPATAVQYYAIAHYDAGASKTVTGDSAWSVEPSALATVSQGLLQATPDSDGQTLTLHVAYQSAAADKQVRVVAGTQDASNEWDTYQANARHTGFVPIALDPQQFTLKWQRQIASGLPLNPVAAADGKVFVSLLVYFLNQDTPTFYALDARDGETLWSKAYGSIFSVNPPAYSYGNVYIQTGNHASDTFLHAYDASTGDLVFDTPHEAQWERYYAPTPFDGSVYVDGGYYGGMYGFDAFSGEQHWFLGLPQYDQWTPAVDDTQVYAYLGEYSPGLYVADRTTGALLFTIPDPAFDWNGWSMDLAPVLGDDGEVLAIHDGRLIRFDLASRSIGWQRVEQFSGQPSLAAGQIYAVNGGSLDVLDEHTGAPQWSWTPPAGEAIEGPLVVTRSHVLASTASNVYAIELISHTAVWSYPVAGALALANESLYVASADGTLTAISLPEFQPTPPASLEITGPASVTEGTSAKYTALVKYGDGRVRDRTSSVQWSVQPATHASIAADGTLGVSELLAPTESVVLHASYSEQGVTVEADLPVELQISVTLDAFVDRNIAEAQALERAALDQLEQALMHEQAAQAVITPARGGHAALRANGAASEQRADLRRAIIWTGLGQRSVERSADLLQGIETGSPAQAPRPGSK